MTSDVSAFPPPRPPPILAKKTTDLRTSHLAVAPRTWRRLETFLVMCVAIYSQLPRSVLFYSSPRSPAEAGISPKATTIAEPPLAAYENGHDEIIGTRLVVGRISLTRQLAIHGNFPGDQLSHRERWRADIGHRPTYRGSARRASPPTPIAVSGSTFSHDDDCGATVCSLTFRSSSLHGSVQNGRQAKAIN